MAQFILKDLKVGDDIPAIILPPVSRKTLALFAGASGDHNPIHIDIDYAQAAGMKDVFGHGMLGMAYMSRLLTDIVPAENIRDFNARFVRIMQLYDVLTCQGTVIEELNKNDENCLRLELAVKTKEGETVLSGSALVAI